MKLITDSPEETTKLGMAIGEILKPGSLLCIEGQMGAGKTALSQGILRGLRVTDRYITSPTYTLVNEYNVGNTWVYHFDIYRISDYDELLAIGFEEYLREDSIVIIEWADLIREELPQERIWVNIKALDKADNRLFQIKSSKEGNILAPLRKWELK